VDLTAERLRSVTVKPVHSDRAASGLTQAGPSGTARWAGDGRVGCPDEREAALVPGAENASGRRRRVFLAVTITVTVVLVPWTVLLGLTLPDRYVVAHWTAAWIGIDVAELLLLGATSYLALRRRPETVLVACMAAAVLCCDAVFDVTTASTRRDQTASVLTAVLIELPLAALLLITAWRHFHRLLRTANVFATAAPSAPAGTTTPAEPERPTEAGQAERPAEAGAPVAPAARSVRDNAAVWLTAVLPSRAETRDGPVSSR
jgi:hypothetical protein